MIVSRFGLSYVFGGLSVLWLMTGCQAPSDVTRAKLFFPSPPAAPRIQYLTFANGAREVGSYRSSFDEFVLGEEGVDRRRLNKPYGVAAHDGSLYVCDSKGLSLVRMDFKNKAYSVIGTRGPGRLRKPINVAIDALGYKFVVDPIRGEIVVFSPDDKFVTTFGLPEPAHPVDVAVFGDELFVLDNDETPQVVVLNRESGEVIRTFGSDGSDPGQFHIPGSISVGPKGDIFVSDTMNWRLQRLTSEGKPVWAKGGLGTRLGQFVRPRGIRVGPDGVVFVVDGATEIVQMFDDSGQLLMHFGGAGETPGALLLPSSVAVDKSCIPYFQKYIHEDFVVDYLVFVVNQYGPQLISIYAFGSFPEGYRLQESQIARLPTEGNKSGVRSAEELAEPRKPDEPEEEPPGEQEEKPPTEGQD